MRTPPPTRTCIACRTPRAKRELVRIVRTPQGEIVSDPTGRRPGRGAYLCADEACLELGLAGGQLARALGSAIASETRERLAGEVAEIARARHAVAQSARSAIHTR